MNKKTKKRTLSMALAAALAFSPVQALAASSDIAGHWAEEVITQWESAGMISGYEDGTFRPNNSVTRAEFVIMMNNALGLTETGEVSFSDVQPGNWFYNAVAIAVAAGYCSGYEDGTFKPSATITRAEAAVMIANAAGLTQDETGAAGFTDSIPAWAKGSIGAVVNAGFMSGYPDGTFAANQSITRAEAVSSLNRVIGGVTANDVVVTEATEIADQTIEGNLIIDAALTDGTVTVKNTTVTGNIVVRGGAAEALKLDGVTLKGKLIVEKEGAEVVLTGATEVPSVEISALSTLSADNFKGSVGTVTIKKNLDTAKTVKLSVPADKVVLDGTAAVDVNEDVTTVEVTKNAEGSKVYVNSGATVDTVVADAKVAVSGSGTVKLLEVNADDVTVSTSLKVNKTEVAEGVKEPTTTTGGGGGGGGGSSSTADDDDVLPYKTFTVAKDGDWATAQAAAKTGNHSRMRIVIPANSTATDITGTLEYGAKGTLKVEVEKQATVASLDIVAPEAANIYLEDTANGTSGFEATTLGIDAPKATVNSEWKSTTINAKAVSNATLNLKDEVTTVNIAKGSVDLQNGGKTDVVVKDIDNQKADVVKVSGTAQSLNVQGSATAEVTIDAKITGTTTLTSAKSVTVAQKAEVDALDITAVAGAVTINGGSVAKLTVDGTHATKNLALNGGTIGEVAAATGVTTLTLQAGDKVTSTAAIGKVTPDAANTTAVNVTGLRVDTLALDGSTKAVKATLTNATVNTVDATAATNQIDVVTAGSTTVNALAADGNGTVAVSGTTGALKGIAVTSSAKVTLEDAAQLTSNAVVVTDGTGTVTATTGQDTVDKLTKQVKAFEASTKTTPLVVPYKGELPLNQIDVKVTYNDGTVETTTADKLGALLTVGTFDNTKILEEQTVALKYVVATPAEIKVSVQMAQAEWETAAKDAVVKVSNNGFEDDKTIEQKPGKVVVPTVIAKDDTEVGEALVVTWTSSNTEYVTVAPGTGNTADITVVKAHPTEDTTVTVTASIKGDTTKNTTTDTYTITIPAANAGAKAAWAAVFAKLPAEIKIDTAEVDTKEERIAKIQELAVNAAKVAADTEANANQYTYTVTDITGGTNGKYSATVEVKGSAELDKLTTTFSITLVDQNTNVNAALDMLKSFTSVKIDSGKLTGTAEAAEADKAIVEAAIKAQAEAVLDGNETYKDYTVSIEQGSTYDAVKKVWKGQLIVSDGQLTAKDATVRTITAVEGTVAAATATALEGTITEFTKGSETITVTLTGDTFKAGQSTDVTSWFQNTLPQNVKATLAIDEKDAKIATITLSIDGESVATNAQKLKLVIPKSAMTNGTEDVTASGELTVTLADNLQFNVDVANGVDTVIVKLSADAKEKGVKFASGAATADNWKWNKEAVTSATIAHTNGSDSSDVLIIKLAKAEDAGITKTLSIENVEVFDLAGAEGYQVTKNTVDIEAVKLYDNDTLGELNVTVGTLAAGTTAPQATTDWDKSAGIKTEWYDEAGSTPATEFETGETYTAKITVTGKDFVGFDGTALSSAHDNIKVNDGKATISDVSVDATTKAVTITTQLVAQAPVLTPDKISLSKIVDQSGAAVGDLCNEDYEVTAPDTLVPGKDAVNHLDIAVTGLKAHRNGDGTWGHWVGFSVVAPEGATQYKAKFDRSRDKVTDLETDEEASLSTKLDQDIDGRNGQGVAFYSNLSDTDPSGPKKFASLQFFNAKSEAVTPVYVFELNLDDVNTASKAVDVSSNTYDVSAGTGTGVDGDATIKAKTEDGSTVIDTKTTVEAFTKNLAVSNQATMIVVATANASSITTPEQFLTNKATYAKQPSDTLADNDVLFVLSEDQSVLAKYAITVTTE